MPAVTAGAAQPAAALPMQRRAAGVSGWLLAALGLAGLVLVPLLALGWTAGQGSDGLWSHLAAHVLPPAALNTVLLLLGVGVVTCMIGVGSAWLVSAYEFPGRSTLGWMLLLPLAVPTYIVAFAYLDLLHPLGPVQGVLRSVLGFDSPREFRLPDIRGLPAAIVLLGLVLYPYVYLTTRAMFMTQAAGLLDAARTLGAGRVALFWRVALPLARPAIAIGLALALLETLNDIGASEFLGVSTLTVAIHTTWVTRSDLPGAAQIALAMLVMVLLLIVLERYGRRRQRYASGQRPRPPQPMRLRGWKAGLAFTLTFIPILLGFFAPASHLAWQSWLRWRSGSSISPQLFSALGNTLTVAVLATLATLVAGLVLAWALRQAQQRRRPRLAQLSLRIGSLGYALPGTVLALGLLAALGAFDAGLDSLLSGSPRPWLMGSLTALVLACMLRFLAISAGTLEAGFQRIAPSMDAAAASLGHGAASRLWNIHLPLLRPALAAAALLVFVDTMKELPATLMLRPMNFETLATWLYGEAARGTYEDGALAGLMIVLAGLLPVILLARTGLKDST